MNFFHTKEDRDSNEMEKNADTFHPSFFEILKKAEEKYFWFEVRRRWIFDSIADYMPPPARLLEIGCGTGNVSSYLAQKGYRVTGCEYYDEALAMAWPGFEKVCADGANLPFPDNAFDVVGLFDVIEHLPDERDTLKEAYRVLRPGGLVVVTVPAREELWSPVDEASFHKRRYTKAAVRHIFSSVSLDTVSITYIFMSLYLPIMLMRRRKISISDQFALHNALNAALKLLLELERRVSKIISLPIGTSLIAIARKGTGP